MQVLKDDVREKILASARIAFKENGFKGASMRSIAEMANISVGNMYRYFKNKDDLLDELVAPLVKKMIEERDKKKEYEMPLLDVNLLEYGDVIESMIEAQINFRDELYILFLRSEGSKYENAREEISKVFEEQFSEFLNNLIGDKSLIRGNLFAKNVTKGLLEVFFTVLENTQTDREFILNLIEYMELVLKPMVRSILYYGENETTSRRISDEEIMDIFNRHSSTVNCNCSKS